MVYRMVEALRFHRKTMTEILCAVCEGLGLPLQNLTMLNQSLSHALRAGAEIWI